MEATGILCFAIGATIALPPKAPDLKALVAPLVQPGRSVEEAMALRRQRMSERLDACEDTHAGLLLWVVADVPDGEEAWKRWSGGSVPLEAFDEFCALKFFDGVVFGFVGDSPNLHLDSWLTEINGNWADMESHGLESSPRPPLPTIESWTRAVDVLWEESSAPRTLNATNPAWDGLLQVRLAEINRLLKLAAGKMMWHGIKMPPPRP